VDMQLQMKKKKLP